MFAGSSARSDRPNPDGSYNVKCYRCGQFIDISTVFIQRALCYVCQLSDEGTIMPEKAMQDYYISKMNKTDIGVLVLREPELDVLGAPKRKFTFSSLTGEFVRAVGKFALNDRTAPEENKAVESVKLSKQKRRGRLFSNITLGDDEVKK